MIVDRISELPAEYECKLCGAAKPIAEMVVVRLKTRNKILLRPRCKLCHNKRERGHRREWKRNYLRRWRKYNAELNESYWRQSNAQNRALYNARAYNRFLAKHDAILIQGRLRRQACMKVSVSEAERMARTYGRAYPTRFGLTPWALRECERTRSAERKLPKHKRHRPIELRMMMYEDGHHKRPARQKQPYQRAAQQLRNWHARQKMEAA